MTRRRKRPKTPQSTPPPLIRDLPPDERPRQRLLRSGPHSLSDAEILSILLGNGCREVVTRKFDQRYMPMSIDLEGDPAGPGERAWTYETDGVGNVLGIIEREVCSAAPLQLQDQTVTTIETVSHCSSIEAGPNYIIEAPGDVRFEAGGGVSGTRDYTWGARPATWKRSSPAPTSSISAPMPWAASRASRGPPHPRPQHSPTTAAASSAEPRRLPEAGPISSRIAKG